MKVNYLQEKTPLFDALLAYVQELPVSCHVPGHKNGAIFHEAGKGIYEQLLKIDATEVDGLDDLHAPEGPILEAQLLLSQLYKSDRSYFLINGSTCGNLAAVMGVCDEEDVVLVQRNCHKSVLHGLMLAKAKPIFLKTIYNEEWGIAEGISPQTVKAALKMYPQAKALILTYPNYYGVGEYIEELITLAHQSDLTVIVDEAHGAHFVAGKPFMSSSLIYGADYVIQSAHKSLPAMTMGSYLHMNYGAKNMEKVESYLRMLQSSSPSYPIMASLDLARSFVGTLSKADVEYTRENISTFINQLNKVDGLKVMQRPENICDILKVTIQTDGTFTGYELQSKLNEQGVYVELADPRNILLVLPILKVGQDYSYARIVNAIPKAVALLKVEEREKYIFPVIEDGDVMTELALSFSEMNSRQTKLIELALAENYIAAETITPYPPGIPYIMNGERLSKRKIAYLQNMLRLGAKFHGGIQLKAKQQILVYI